MKLVKIFGLVVGVHVAVFLLIFAIPGCRSTNKNRSPAAPGAASVSYGGAGAEPIYAAPAESNSLSASDLNPAISPAPASEPVSFDSGAASTVRFSPTRPGTPVAQTVQTQPVGNVAPVTIYTVVKGDSYWAIAKKHGLSVSELTRANDLGANSPLRPGQKLLIPAKAVAEQPEVAADAPASKEVGKTYIVKSGDTLSGIAQAHGTSPAELRSLNKLRNDTLRVDQTLLLPSDAVAPSAAVESGKATAGSARSASSTTHTVAPGETLGGIARRYSVRVGVIADANKIADPRRIRPGQKLVIPGAEAPKVASTPSVAVPAPVQSAPAATSSDPANPFIAPAPIEAPPTDLKTEPDDVPVIQVEEPLITPAPQSSTPGGEAPRIE